MVALGAAQLPDFRAHPASKSTCRHANQSRAAQPHWVMILLPKGLIDLPDGRLASGIRRHEGDRALLEMDALSAILRGIRLTGSAFIDAELSAPWSVQTPTSSSVGRLNRR
jgi:hypothetical protein